jgi:CRP-like cAMP-binding protein
MRNLAFSFSHYDPRSELDQNESEYIRLCKGHCFGEWGLIYNMSRTTSAVTVEDTEFFTLSKQHFLESFGVRK